MRIFKFLRACAPVALLATVTVANSYADIVVNASAGAQFYNFAPDYSTGSGSAFFHAIPKASDDNLTSADCNIGALLNGNTTLSDSVCRDIAGSLPASYIGTNKWQFLGGAAPSTAPSWELQRDPLSGGSDVTLLLEVAGNRNFNEIGYYTYDARGGIVYVKLYDGTDVGIDSTPVNSFLVNASEIYGFYIKGPDVFNPAVTNTYRSGSTNRVGLFRPEYNGVGNDLNVGRFLVGFEDGIDFDYQDAVIFATVVPEPSSIVVLSSAILGVAALVRRRKRA